MLYVIPAAGAGLVIFMVPVGAAQVGCVTVTVGGDGLRPRNDSILILLELSMQLPE
jgi:hypothetical protein